MVVTKTVLGLDLGSYALKAVELRQGLRGLEFVQSQIAARADDEGGLGEAIRRFAESHALNTDHAACAISGQRIAHRRLEFPFRDRKNLAQAIPFEIEGSMPFDLDDLVVDWQLLPGASNLGVVAASAAQKDDIGDFLEEIDAQAFAREHAPHRLLLTLEFLSHDPEPGTSTETPLRAFLRARAA